MQQIFLGWLCTLPLCWTHLLVPTGICVCVWNLSRVFYVEDYILCKQIFSSLPLYWIPFISFSYLIALAGTCSVTLYRNGKNRHQFLTIEHDVWFQFVFTDFLSWGSLLLLLGCWVFLSRKDVEFCQCLFLYQLKWSCGVSMNMVCWSVFIYGTVIVFQK